VIAVYVGERLETLRSVAGNDDACRLRSALQFKPTAGTTYRIAVAGFHSAQGSIKLRLAS
jgi:hypothetical protein